MRRPSTSTAWRLTDRGIAAILVVGVLLAVAAVAVVGLTAIRVTGDLDGPTTPSYSADA